MFNNFQKILELYQFFIRIDQMGDNPDLSDADMKSLESGLALIKETYRKVNKIYRNQTGRDYKI